MNENYIKLTENDLKKLHKDLLVLLVEFDRICSLNNINYYMTYGTLIGAVRHKGFIPWDDDLDVYMLRNDYDKFCDICKSDLSDDFLLQTQDTDKHYNWSYGKLRLKNTDFIRSGQEHIKQKTGIFMDIIPLDNITDNKLTQNTIGYICKVLRKILWSKVGMVSEINISKKIFYRLLSMIPRRLVINIFNFFTKRFNGIYTNYLISNHFSYSNNRNMLILNKEWFSDCIKLDFEGHKFSAPVGYDYILKSVYGDYMKIPPKKDQVGNCYASYIKFSDGSELKLQK